MGRYKRMSIVMGAAIILFVIIAYFFFPVTPCSSLKMEEIKEIRIFYVPPEQTVILSQEELAKAVDLLQDMKAYHRGYMSNSLIGQAVKFTIIKSDGTEIEIIIVGNTTITINGASYRAQYATTEAVTSFANSIITGSSFK